SIHKVVCGIRLSSAAERNWELAPRSGRNSRCLGRNRSCAAEPGLMRNRSVRRARLRVQIPRQLHGKPLAPNVMPLRPRRVHSEPGPPPRMKEESKLKVESNATRFVDLQA